MYGNALQPYFLPCTHRLPAAVHLQSMVVGGNVSMEHGCTRSVPADMTVLNLRRLCHQVFGLGQNHTSLSLRNSPNSFAEPLDDMRELSYYGAQDGCEILVLTKEE